MDDEENSPAGEVGKDDKAQLSSQSFLRQLYCCSAAFLLPAFGAFMKEVLFVMYRTEDYSSMYVMGEIVGVLSGGIFLSLFGRRLALIFSNLVYFCFSFFSYFLFFGKTYLINPLCVGFISQFSTMAFIFYIAEISSAPFRAFLMGFYYISYHLADYYLMTIYVTQVAQVDLVSIALAAGSSIMSAFVPETPYYLAVKDELEKAEGIFSWIRAGTETPAEYDLMVDKAKTSLGLQGIFSHTFAVCMIMCILLGVCNVNGCELLQEVYYHMHSLADFSLENPEYHQVYVLSWFRYTMENFIGALTFCCISLVIPRKIIYGMGFALTLLLLVPLVLASSAYNMIFTLHHFCNIISSAGRDPLALILPVEILPTVMRTVGLMAMYIVGNIIEGVLYVQSDAPLATFVNRKFGRMWIIFSYSISLIGVPFLLLFMPETKNKSIFELEEVTIRLADILPSRKTDVQDEEESAPE